MTGPSKLKERFEKEIRDTSYDREHRETGVLSLDFINSLFYDEQNNWLRQSLEDDLKKRGSTDGDFQKELNDLRTFVLSNSTNLYAILVYSGCSEWIVDAYRCNPRIDDWILRRQSSHEHLGDTVPKDIAEHIIENRWIIPPVLTPDSHRDYSSGHFRLPFVSKPKLFDRGSYGNVYKVKIARGHLKAVDVDTSIEIVCKEAVIRRSETEQRMLQEVDTLRARKHRNIVPLLASFTARSEESVTKDSPDRSLFMLFPIATGGNLKKWLNQESAPKPLKESTARQEFVYCTMQDIVSGLAYIHREIDQRIAYHHDLKPSNILLFEEGGKSCWKICDFGKGHVKRVEDGTGTTRTESNYFGTYDYLPPEYFPPHDRATDDTRDVEKHGRAFDVYGLGCVFLELATIHKYGWSPDNERGLPLFTEQRRRNKCLHSRVDGEDKSFHNNENIVKLWITNYLKGNNYNVHFDTVIEMIECMLESRKQRIFAWEVDMELYYLRHRHEDEEKLKTRFRDLVQGARAPLTALDNQHNPLRRAESKARPDWWKAILMEHNWSNKEPTTTGDLAKRKWASHKPRYSTLNDYNVPVGYSQNRFFSRHEVDAKITEGFKKSDNVGLWGLPGVGKSHLAFRHAIRYREPAQPEDGKHTFWVNAANEIDFNTSLEALAVKINSDRTEAERLDIADLKDWLMDSDNGPWIMVLDGLDDNRLAENVAKQLPRDHGQILITTKSRAICKHFMQFQDDVCLQVNNLELDDRRAIFRYYNPDPVMDDKNISHYLLEKIYLPDHIRLVATYLAEYYISAETLYDDLKAGNRETIHRAVKGSSATNGSSAFEFYGDKIFSSLISDSALRRNEQNAEGPWPCIEMEILGKLSCFGQVVHSDLIALISPKYMQFKKMLGELRNLSFLTPVKPNNYYMPEFLHEAVHDWIEKRFGMVKLLNLYEFALETLLDLHRQETKASFTPGPNTHVHSDYLRIVKFRPHFDRFVEFVRLDRSTTIKGEVSDAMVKAVLTFSQLYLDDAYYQDAIDVLVFMCNHEHKRHLRLRFQLIQAYILSRAEVHLNQAEQLLKELQREASNREKAEDRARRKLLFLQLWNNSARPDNSIAFWLESCELHITIENDTPMLPGSQRMKKYAIRLHIEKARAHLLKARHTEATQGERKQQLVEAFKCLEVARSAACHWFDGENSLLLQEIEEIDADVSFETGEPAKIKKAADFLEGRVKAVRLECETKGRAQIYMWDLQCKLARVWGGTSDIARRRKAVDTLERLYKSYKEQYGEAHRHTLRCDEYRKEACAQLAKSACQD